MFLLILAAVLLAAGQSAPLADCGTLTQQLQIQGRDQFLGRWTYAAESTNIPGSKMLTKMFVENVWGEVSPANESDSISVRQLQKMFGSCYSVTSKMTLANNTLTMAYPLVASEVLLTTSCSDCMVLLSNYTIGESTFSGVQLMTRRPKVLAAEMDEFKRQVDCLNLPPPAILDSEKGFCPDDSKDTETTDLTSMIAHSDSEYMKLFEKLVSSEAGIKTLLGLISHFEPPA
ncbi:uncharacterized protein LOC129182958 [Dunckerocampus dactyliophorus]|uniref:uncharacterized protein LOC129182958 n=1 Tax=Dunckerocampus dactyliophorus TaxID=161453 RepID=UPI0024057BE5|nr:uncharacterized protein LOC129182958 [Dunckerocampus dactyliophorus]